MYLRQFNADVYTELTVKINNVDLRLHSEASVADYLQI